METNEELYALANEYLEEYKVLLHQYEKGNRDSDSESFEKLRLAQMKYADLAIFILMKNHETMKVQDAVIRVLATELAKGATT